MLTDYLQFTIISSFINLCEDHLKLPSYRQHSWNRAFKWCWNNSGRKCRGALCLRQKYPCYLRHSLSNQLPPRSFQTNVTLQKTSSLHRNGSARIGSNLFCDFCSPNVSSPISRNNSFPACHKALCRVAFCCTRTRCIRYDRTNARTQHSQTKRGTAAVRCWLSSPGHHRLSLWVGNSSRRS